MRRLDTMRAASLLAMAAFAGEPEIVPAPEPRRGPKPKTQADFDALAKAAERRRRRNAKRAREST
jgi:predicted pyridoxine 5'-phosphate oxidase superfamily flavin-nucleotide-binding protein